MKINLPYLSTLKGRDGSVMLYVRRNGLRVRLRERKGTIAFQQEYARAVERVSRLSEGKTGPERGTLSWLGALYFASREFAALGDNTKYQRRKALEGCFRELYTDGTTLMGECPVDKLTAQGIKRFRDLKQDAPAMANYRRASLSVLFSWAIEQTPPLAKSNPVRDVRQVKYATDGFHTWTPTEVAQFEAHYAIGTKERLALALMLYTGCRRSDVVRLGPGSVTDGWLRFVPWKTRAKRAAHTEKPWLPVLADIVELCPCGAPTVLLNDCAEAFREQPWLPVSAYIVEMSPCGATTFLLNERGKAFRADIFRKWFRPVCDRAVLPQCTAHGLRKAGATLAAESGASIHQLMAIFDWRTPGQAKVYTDAADGRRLTGQSMGMLKRE